MKSFKNRKTKSDRKNFSSGKKDDGRKSIVILYQDIKDTPTTHRNRFYGKIKDRSDDKKEMTSQNMINEIHEITQIEEFDFKLAHTSSRVKDTQKRMSVDNKSEDLKAF